MKKDFLLLHGAIGSQKQFTAIAENISSQYTIHRLNFSGHGGSAIKSDFNIALFMKDVEDYIRNHNLQKLTIFGYSMGGYVALKLAATGVNYIEKIITLGTKFDWSEAATAKELKMLNPDKIEEKVPKFAATLQKEHEGEDWKEVVRQTAKMMQQLSTHDQLTKQELKNITIPVRLGLGDSDKMVSETETKWALQLLPNADFVQLKDSPHPLMRVPIKAILKLIE